MSDNIAIFAAGCFWGVENNFMDLEGVIGTSVGYIGSNFKDPTYFDVCTGATGHAEAVRVQFDDSIINFEELCNFFFKIHDPTTLNRQGPDSGSQYRSAIFCLSTKQKEIATGVVKKLEQEKIFPSIIVTEICDASQYYLAEDYHQKYIKKNNLQSCGG
ncbi:peptide-methionine (S)-S-oxide reductase MsrA [bacterium]|jgi:peptide-methionine (S)-S-oxide reductase|nr:peptide-methionine (S)-S-oxide reductase MsrA [bacterium]